MSLTHARGMFLCGWDQAEGTEEMSARHRLKVGYVGVSITPYFAEKYRVRELAIAALRGYAQELDFDLVAIERPLSLHCHSSEQ